MEFTDKADGNLWSRASPAPGCKRARVIKHRTKVQVSAGVTRVYQQGWRLGREGEREE